LTVTETKDKGTKPEVQALKNAGEEGQTPKSKEVSSTPPKLYTQVEADALVHAAKSEAGRVAKEIEGERNSLKVQMLSKDNELEDTKADLKNVQKQIDELTSGDPAKFDLVTKERELKAQERQLKAEKLQIEQERESLIPALETKREIEIWDVASAFEDGDPVRLKALADTFEAKSKEKYQVIAESLGWKLKDGKPPADPEPMKPYPGHTEGGAHLLGDLPPKERLVEAERRLRQ